MSSSAPHTAGREADSVLISVIIAAYNAESFIPRAIESVRAQTISNWEIVVADDCSADGTCAVVEAMGERDGRIRLVRSAQNGGPSRARNRAIAQARGRWVAILDADDAWLPRRLEHLLDLAEARGAEIVADNLIFYDDHAQAEIGVAFASGVETRPLTADAVILSERPWPTFRYGFLKPMVRTDFLKSTSLAYNETFRYAEDFLFLTEALLRGARGALSETPFYIYTVQLNSVSGRRSSTSRSTYDPDQRLRMANYLHDAYGPQAGDADKAALATFVRWMRDLRAGYAAVNGTRAREPGSLGRLFRTSPKAIATYLVTTPTWKRILHSLSAATRPPADAAKLSRRIM